MSYKQPPKTLTGHPEVMKVYEQLTPQDLITMLAHKLNMQDKMLALFEVEINESMPDYFDLVADMEILTKEGAIITYGVKE